MGSGKSLVGKILANKINFNFVDTDKLIEKKIGKSINRIFKEDGEIYFRQLEDKIITDILSNDKTVISLGGGSIENNNIRKIIKKNSYNIYLQVKLDILISRLIYSSNRPLLKKNNMNLTLTKLLNKRSKFYQKADLIINNNTNTKFVIEKILNILNEND